MMSNSRVSISGKINDLIWNDEEFYNYLSQHKKASAANKFPRYDQWYSEEDGLHMAFALAGYSIDDISIFVSDSELTVSSNSQRIPDESSADHDKDLINKRSEVPNLMDDELLYIPPKKPSSSVTLGVIVRGIARRSFRTKFVLNNHFDLTMTSATMKNGLLEVVIPKKKEVDRLKIIEIKEK
jgi:HSP20 family molecular chaperone IbpA